MQTDRAALLAGLKARLARTELVSGRPRLSLCPEIDEALPEGGLPTACLHEILAAEPGAATAFATLLLARAQAMSETGSVLWISHEPDACPQGLARMGLAPRHLVLVRAPRAQDALWATEEAARCPAVAATLLHAPSREGPDMTALRRLQLAAETGGGITLLLGADTEAPPPSPARRRWRVRATAEGAGHGTPAWELELLMQRGGRPNRWHCSWNPAQDRLTVLETTPAPRRRRG
jgi:protein ImuA